MITKNQIKIFCFLFHCFIFQLVNGQKLSCGSYHTSVICADSMLNMVGYNGYGQIGNGTTTDVLYPIVNSSITGVKKVVNGFYHTVILKGNGTVWASGYNA